MQKLPMCRICLVENVHMYVVVNRNLHELYEKLTDIPFVTEDSRPMLACFFCCAKLKQCYRLLRKCLDAEELFAQMMNEDYEPNPLINQDQLEFCSGFIKSPIEHISIDNECQTESIAIKEELTAVCEGIDDITEPKEEHQSDELEPENLDKRCINIADSTPHHSESDLEDDVPLMEFKTEVDEEQEVSKKKRRAREAEKLKPESIEKICLDVADITPHHSESDLEDDVPIIEFKTEVEEEQEVFEKKRRAREAKCASAVEKPKLDTRRIKTEDAITAEQKKNELSDSEINQNTQHRTSKPEEPFTYTKPDTRIHHYEKPYKCDLCKSSFSTVSSLKRHIQNNRIHPDEKPYKCDVCQRSFRQKGDLTTHIRIHTGDKPYKCDVCQRSFRQKYTLTTHIRIHTGEKPYECETCQRSFSRFNLLKRHIRIHTGEMPYKCDVCQRSVSTFNSLKRHMRTHTGEKPFECDICQHSFKDKIDLIIHIRRHTGVNPYKCDVCQRSFIKKSILIQHIRIHTGEKPYKCDVCQRSFRHKYTLTTHIRIHTGENSYKCETCLHSFQTKSNLTRHLRIHTGENHFK